MHPSNVWCFTKEAIVAMRRRKLIAVATLSTSFIALLVLSATIVAGVNMSLVSAKLRSSAEVTVFLRKDATASERTTFEAWLVNLHEVGKYDYVSPETAIEELAAQLGNDARLLEAAEGNPIPPSFRIRAAAPERVHGLVTALRKRSEVFRVVYASEATARLLNLSRLLNAAGVALSLLLGVAAITIIHNAMAVAIDARRRDIRIMRLVGADPSLIRLPYLINGVLYGVAGALTASLVTIATYALALGTVKAALPFLPMAAVGSVAAVTLPVTVGFGSIFGLVGASLSLSRHLQPHRSPTATPGGQLQVGRGAKVAVAALALGIVVMGAAAVRAEAGLSENIGRAKRLGTAVAGGTHRLKELDTRLRDGQKRLARLKVRMAELESHIARATAAKEGLSQRLSDQLFSYYAADRNSQLEVLTASGSVDDAVVSSARLRFVLESEYGAFDRARSTLDTLARSQAALDAVKDEAAGLVRELKGTRRQLAARLATQKTALEKLTAQIEESLQVYGSAARGKVIVYGTDGFIFPVASPHNFSNDWHAPRQGHLHQGTDVFAQKGSPLLSVVAGTVRLGTNTLGGTVIHLDGDDGTMYYYAHLAGYAPGLSSGEKVAPGQLVGFVGNRGNARGTPPHLHFEVHPGGGAANNPYPILSRADSVLFEP